MRHRTQSLLVVGLAILALGVAPLRAANSWHDESYRAEFHQMYALAADGELSLQNLNGSVQVSTWDQNEVKVDAVKHADSQAKLDAIQIDVDSEPSRLGIETRYHPHSSNNPGGVEYTLTIPRRARIEKMDLVNGSFSVEDLAGDVRASLVNGNVNARGLTGEIELSAVNGKLDVTLNQPDLARRVKLDSVNGRIQLSLPPDANADLEASAVNGSINTDFPITVRSHWPVGRSLEGTLGHGGSRIELSSVNGSISIERSSRVPN
jgi:Toastrack DUF4097